MNQAGLSARAAADQLGHARPSITQDVYFGRGIKDTGAAAVLEVLPHRSRFVFEALEPPANVAVSEQRGFANSHSEWPGTHRPVLVDGGSADGTVLPEFITHLVSLSRRKPYTVAHDLASHLSRSMTDTPPRT